MTTISDDDFVRLFQELHGLKVDGWAGLETVAKLRATAPVRVPATPEPAIVLPDAYWPLLAKIESAGNPKAKASTSSASGLYQFIRASWLGEGGSWGTDMSKPFGGLVPYPTDAEQLARAKSFTMKNARYLVGKGVPINPASLYAAHFLGPVTAAAVIAADVKASAETLAGPAATAANKSILQGKTVGEFLSWLNRKTGYWAR